MHTTINFGIDLGTTNSAIASFIHGEISIYKNPSTLKETIASVVGFRGDRMIIGEKARELVHKSPDTVFGSFKRKMGTSDKYYSQTMDRVISPIELSTYLLRELKNFIHSGDQLDSIVITIPAAFDTMQSNATKKAGYEAGFQEVVLLQEPIAASLAYANKSGVDVSDGKWLVYDLGGGTFDVALVSILHEEMKIIDHEGDNYLGGSDFDIAIVDEFIIPELSKKGEFNDIFSQFKNNQGKHHNLYTKLIFIAEETKIALTNKSVSEIEFEVIDDLGNEIEVYLELTREKFEKIISPYIDKSVDMIQTIFKRNNIDSSEIKFILLVGGSTYIPSVRSLLSQKTKIEINATLDPTTAVVVGAAYYAGMKPKNIITPNTGSNIETKKISVKLAFERVVQDLETMAILVSDEAAELGYTYNISRQDGGFDTGKTVFSGKPIIQLPLVPNAYNVFYLHLYDLSGDKVQTETIGITQGKFSIEGQPLPEYICLEVDDIDANTTFLEPVFKKNDILPLKKTIVKQVAKTITKGTSDYIHIKVLEGSIDSLPSANKLIGMIEITGNLLDRDLVKGSDIELVFEISESRDIKVSAYLILTDQEFENTFNPHESHVTKTQLLEELNAFRINLLKKQKGFETTSEYEKAGQINQLLETIRDLESKVKVINEDDNSDLKHKIDIEKRELGKKIFSYFNSSYLTKTIEEYYDSKRSALSMTLNDQATEEDRKHLTSLISTESSFLQGGNATIIKMKTDQLNELSSKIFNRKPFTDEDWIDAFYYFKSQVFEDQESAKRIIKKGDVGLQNNNIYEIKNTVVELSNMLEKQKKQGSEDMYRSKGTGLK